MQVVWTQNAIADLASIYEYIASDSKHYAAIVVERLTGRTKQLADFPHSGQMVPEYLREDIRELIEYSYRIICLTNESTVSVLTVIHGARPLPDAPDFSS